MHRAPSPLNTFLLVWGGLMICLGSGLIVYDDIELYSTGTLYLLSCIGAFSGGYLFAKRHSIVLHGTRVAPSVTGISWPEEIGRYRRMITLGALSGIVAAALFAIDTLVLGGLSMTSFMEVRNVFIERHVTLLSQLAAVLGAGGFFSLCAAILYWELVPPLTRSVWILSPIGLSLFSVLSGGRQTVLQLLLFSFFAIVLRHKMRGTSLVRSRKTIVLFGLVFLVVLAYGMIVGHQRNEREEEGIDKKTLVLAIMEAHLDPEAEAFLDDLPDVVRDGTAEMFVYFTHTIPNFLVFWEQERPGPYWGLWELPFLARRLNNLGVVEQDVDGRMDHVYESFADSGRFAQVWQTVVRDLIIDFTPVGALVALLVLGYLAGRAVRNYEQDGGVDLAFLLLGVNVLSFYSILFSAISDTFLFFYMLGCLALVARRRLLKRSKYLVAAPA